MTTKYTYYDGRSVVQRESMKEIEGALATLQRLVDVARFPSGHKVWRVAGLDDAPTIRFETKDHGEVVIEPVDDYTLGHMFTEWVEVTRWKA